MTGSLIQGSSQKFNFSPQIYEPTQVRNNENSCSSNNDACKKIRKSGLTLLKMNHAN